MQKIYITEELHTKLINYRRGHMDEGAEILVLGANRYGVCTTALELNEDGERRDEPQYDDETGEEIEHDNPSGCQYMPGLTSSELAARIIELAKKRLKFGGFAYLSPNSIEYSEPQWNREHGDAIYRNKGVIFLEYCTNNTQAEVYDGHNIRPVEIGIVKATYKPKTPAKPGRKKISSIKRSKKG